MSADRVFGGAALVAGKDLRLELRSRVAFSQVVPFAVLVLLLFAFALDVEGDTLRVATPGLYWMVVLFSALLTVQRAFATEAADGVRDALRLSVLDPASIFLGKACALVVQLVALEALLLLGVAVLYGAELRGPVLLVVSAVLATLGIAATGTLYGALAAGLRVRETLLPLLLLPVLAPVLIAATTCFELALDGRGGEGWGWCGLLGTFALAYAAFGTLAFGPLLEES
jgi:heme exporter protein B